jgi:predicted site-specific integrase-resolvase
VPIVNMTQAATMAGIGRTTLYRKAKQGVLSTTTMPDGSPGVDTAELFRVFPVKQSGGTVSEEQVNTHETLVETALLRQRVQHLEELLTVERQRNTELSHTLKLIEHKAADQPRRGFWSRVFGGGE